MAEISAAHDLFQGDTAPAAPDAGYVTAYMLGNMLRLRLPDGTLKTLQPRWTVSLAFFGEAILDAQFDRFQAREAVKIVAAELSAQEAPTGSDLTVTLVAMSGASLGKTVTLPGLNYVALADYAGAPLAIAAGGAVRGKITAIGSATPGGWLHLKLHLESA